jgi:hypothetical protein
MFFFPGVHLNNQDFSDIANDFGDFLWDMLKKKILI